MHVLYYDENGDYAGEEDIDAEVLPPNSTDLVWDPSIVRPRFDKKKNVWVEAATEEYKESIKPGPPTPSEVEVLRNQVAELYYIIAMGGV